MSDLESVLDKLVKKWGDGTVWQLEDVAGQYYEGLSTGCLALDLATGIGGYPKGGLATIYGPDQGGKTTLCLWCLACLRQTGGKGVYIDVEHKTPGSYIADIFRSAGADVDNLPILKFDTGAGVLDAVEQLIGSVDLIVVDSIASLVPGAELDGDVGDVHVGLQARLISQAMRRIGPLLDLSGTALLCTNQVRDKIGGYGSSEARPGGWHLAFKEVLRVRISRIGREITHRGEKVGITCKAVIRKNQAAAPGGEAAFDILWNKGVDVVRDTFEVAKALSILEKKGSYYYYDWDEDGETPGIQGEIGVMQRFREDLDLMGRIRTQALETIQPQFQSGKED